MQWADHTLRSNIRLIFSPTLGTNVLADEKRCIVEGLLGCHGWLVAGRGVRMKVPLGVFDFVVRRGGGG